MSRRASPSAAVVDVGLLALLLHARDAHTIDSLSRALGTTPDDVLREASRLRRAGCVLEEHPQRGVRMLEAGLGAWTDYLESVSAAPRVVACYRATASTQDVARQLVEARGRGAEGALVTADEQTAGRGRLGRAWIAPAGSGLALSLVTHSADALGAIDRLTFAASVAVARVVERAVGPGSHVGVTIKWPNDVLVDGRKIAGILVETLAGPDGRAAILGIGVNCRLRADDLPAELRGRVTSLAMHGCDTDRLFVLGELVHELDTLLAHDVAPLLPEWRRRCAMLGQRVAFQTHGRAVTGEVMDLDPYLGLIVRTDDGAITHLPAATTTVVV